MTRGGRCCDGYLLQDVYDRHPELVYEPLDAERDPGLMARVQERQSNTADDEYDRIEAFLIALIEARTATKLRSQGPTSPHE